MNNKTIAAIAAGAGCLAALSLRRGPRLSLARKIVLVTGGSRGLGLAIAREFGSQGAIVAICARDKAELGRAQADLIQRGVRAHSFVCDVSNRDRVNSMVNDIAALLGPVDILVNNAGTIKVGPFAQMDASDFEQAMDVIFWGTLNTTFAVLPAMRARRKGSIVNITSIGGKVSVPHLLPYSCAKFAAAALSEGLRTELAPAGIRVTTIAPGLLRTGSHLNARFKGKQDEEYAWFAAGAATPVVSIAAERAARSVVRATTLGTAEKILSVPADLLARFHGLFPNLTSELLTIANRFLPADGGSRQDRSGSQIEAEFNSSLWKILTRMGQHAANFLNETASHSG